MPTWQNIFKQLPQYKSKLGIYYALLNIVSKRLH